MKNACLRELFSEKMEFDFNVYVRVFSERFHRKT